MNIKGGMAKPADEGMGTLVSQLAEGVATLVTQHVLLARMELSQEAREVGGALARVAICIPFFLVGYLLLCGAGAVGLGRWLGLAGGLAVVGGFNAVVGGVVLAQVRRFLKPRAGMSDTVSELQRSATWLANGKATGGPNGYQRNAS